MHCSGALLVFVLVVVLGGTGCSRVRMMPDRDTIYMTSTFRALVEGLFEGEVSCGELTRHGDTGIGTFDGLNGEMAVVDGRVYQIKADGSVHEMAAAHKTPYATVTPLDADRVIEIGEGTDFDQLRARLDREFVNRNVPYAFRIDGKFSYVKTRSVPEQKAPYPRLIEVIKNQPTFEFQNVAGTIVGFRLPAHLESVGVPGYHFHFLTADRKGGGHLLAFKANDLHVIGDLSPRVYLTLPENATFATTDLSHASQEEMDTIMGRAKKK